ncbi:MAG: glycoside hydrolase family protein [Microcoleus sp. PH2017_10_PVI_O_A]|nr:glycoside hydrolase family protein [Microcoleus sp. PH2017_10_PVI_O_A]MCC3463673.1 glycoside hydrolase family protein [Microcoleus sp. PH2017_11_PCY_U_A]MCC3482036.1 glycoside hydrolase family protein [Microcoleus sp. PH2017_12_PCY_D_A]MCC3531945.1 glycoside hydrolase family protein [Microcoleus sp. PH2017_21_RUC_O_A]MCC3544274.1 glycoside hydrolase family protein [Microcoleus sp. PH2017_22_RUC_O_B]MCC3563010.1 glycoside hydrolase family protein [Microcoleus sp. PH2017_27_LUM_O_A]
MKTLKWPAWFPYPISWLRAFALAQSFSFVLRRGIPFASDDTGFLTVLLAAWLIQLPLFFVAHFVAVKIVNPLLTMLPGPAKARKFKRRHTGVRSHLREGLNAVVVIFFAFNLALLVQMAIYYWPARSIDPAKLLTGISTLTNVAIAGELDFWLVKLAGALSSLTLLAAPLYQHDFRVRRMRAARKLAEIAEMEMTALETETIRRRQKSLLRRSELQILGFIIVIGAVISSAVFLVANLRGNQQFSQSTREVRKMPPLAMKTGDPYLRALMRTISASESNVSRPYHVVYGGKYVLDLSRHPDWCVKIVNGPNVGKCTTAAGRYQFLTSTWKDKAKRYHPKPGNFVLWQDYSFEPEYQDAVVYAWLSDRKVWKADIPEMLKQERLTDVLRMLSGTWTSLGYGIENNSMSSSLPKVYQKMLREELENTGS